MTTSESGRETVYDDRDIHREGVPAKYKWIHVELIKPFQKSIGSIALRRGRKYIHVAYFEASRGKSRDGSAKFCFHSVTDLNKQVISHLAHIDLPDSSFDAPIPCSIV